MKPSAQNRERPPHRSIVKNSGSFILLTFAALFCLFIVRLGYFGRLSSPPGDMDEIFFDILAINLSAGHGFSGELSKEVHQVYDSLDPSLLQAASWAPQYGADSHTTFRPPLYPFLLAVAYSAAGHSFAAMRALNCLLLAFGSALLLALARDLAPGKFWWLAATLIAVDPHIAVLCQTGLSENLGYLLTCMLFWTIATSPGSNSSAGMSGAILGLLLLARPVFLFWFPPALAAAFIRRPQSEPRYSGFRRASLALGVAIVVYLPWGVRNSLLLHEFAPMGSQGEIALGSVYYNPPPDWDGNWTVEKAVEFERSFHSDFHGADRERDFARYGRGYTRQWLSAHVTELPRIWLARIYSLWWKDAMSYQRFLAVAFGVASTALFFSRSRAPNRILLAFAPFHTLAVALTYNFRVGDFYGRFLLPLYPLFFLVIPLGLSTAFCGRITGLRTEPECSQELSKKSE